MTPHISIHEAAHRLHKTDDETFELLKRGAFAGTPEAKFPMVDPLSLDAYIQRSRPKDQRPPIPTHTEEIAARTAWLFREEEAIRDCRDRYEAVAEYRAEFPNSRRTDEAVGKQWWKIQNRKKQQQKRPWYAAILDRIWPNRARV